MYLAWLQSLPNLKLDRVPRGIEPLRFCFDGGEGMLMPCRPELRRRGGKRRAARIAATLATTGD